MTEKDGNEFRPVEGDFLTRISVPLGNVARALADIEAKLPEFPPEELQAALMALRGYVEDISYQAHKMDCRCRGCLLQTQDTSLEKVLKRLEHKPKQT